MGKEVVEKLYKFKEYTNEDAEEIVSIAKELVCKMVERNKSTVPYISGELMNYKYSLYDSQDETILLAGINTESCFRIDGNDNDFLHYCALDKNGFVIKITDSFDNFIAKASGFRNGNCVFVNQLRSVYDKGENGYNGKYVNEKNDIIATFKAACEDIVTTSQDNNKESKKIDFVFVTQSYSLNNYGKPVSSKIDSTIGYAPMERESVDWTEFVYNTNNLQTIDDFYDWFSTAFANYPIICMASSKNIELLEPDDFEFGNVDAVYKRSRNKVIVTDGSNEVALRKINKINGIHTFFEEEEFEAVEIPDTSIVLTGDNWYIIYNNGEIINSCLLEFDAKAETEFRASKEILGQYMRENISQELNLENISTILQSSDVLGQAKVLKKNS